MNGVKEEWSTDDMSCAAFLVMEGHKVEKIVWDGRSCYFVFDKCVDLTDDMMDFVSGDARVEPREYNMTFARLKREMFGVPGAPARRR